MTNQEWAQARKLRRTIVEAPGTLPILLDAFEVCTILDITPSKLNDMSRKGILENQTIVGPRPLFSRKAVRTMVLAGDDGYSA